MVGVGVIGGIGLKGDRSDEYLILMGCSKKCVKLKLAAVSRYRPYRL